MGPVLGGAKMGPILGQKMGPVLGPKWVQFWGPKLAPILGALFKLQEEAKNGGHFWSPKLAEILAPRIGPILVHWSHFGPNV